MKLNVNHYKNLSELKKFLESKKDKDCTDFYFVLGNQNKKQADVHVMIKNPSILEITKQSISAFLSKAIQKGIINEKL